MTNPDAKNYKDQLPYTPQHSGNASTTIETPWINVGYSLTGVSERYYMAQNIPVNKIDGYVEHTATLWRAVTSAFRQKLSTSLTSNMMLSNIIPCPDVPGA